MSQESLSQPRNGQEPPRIGLVAGWGRYPVVIASTLKRRGYRVFCLGYKDHADPSLRQIVDDYYELGIAKVGGQLRYFLRNEVTHITLAGKIDKLRIIGRMAWVKHLPDLTAMRAFYHHFYTAKKDRRDDTLLTTLVDLTAKYGLTVVPATEFAPELLAGSGRIVGPRLSHAQRKDVQFGWQMAKELGRLDIGQTAAVHGQAVLAIEAIEGTDECIRRAGKLCDSDGFTVVKVAKPQQDMRFDVPAVGMGTLQTMVEAGGRVLAVEADKTIMIDRYEVIRFAKRHRISIVALDDPQSVVKLKAA